MCPSMSPFHLLRQTRVSSQHLIHNIKWEWYVPWHVGSGQDVKLVIVVSVIVGTSVGQGGHVVLVVVMVVVFSPGQRG